MKTERIIQRSVLGALVFALLIYVVLFMPRVHAQAPAGFTKIATTAAATTTYSDTAGLVAGQVNQYVITAFDAAGESGPSNVVTAITPQTTSTACGTGNAHCNNLTWTPAATGSTPTGFNVYKQLVTVPNPVSGLGVVSN